MDTRNAAETWPRRDLGPGRPALPGTAERALLIGSAVLTLAFVAVAYAHTAHSLARAWIHNSNYSHGFLILPIALFLVWNQRKSLGRIESAPSWGGFVFLVPGILLQIVGIRGEVTMFQAYSLILVLAGLVWTWFGPRILRAVAFPLVFLVFAAPTFPVFMNQISFRLKTVAAVGSVNAARALGVTVSRQGMDLLFPNGSMTIEGACSGLNSLIALMALGALFVHLGRGPLWRRLILFVLSVPVALAANLVRITSLCVYAGLTNTERATGLFHDIGGFVLFGVALLILFSVKKALRC